jgi:hypothetical protein
MKIQMKPETIKRRAIQRREKIAARRAEHIERLRAIVAADDPTGVYAELLADAQERQAKTLAKL